ncbi:hypothetical protein NQ314_008522 [Rhamnusium bicolor]|uniref:Cysteine and histidine-rich domain-containing protein n=1 Tax=Rhamnusium bicolor TaxID=1586634 RepID=A0AAV8Y938_9CUCU|nr:hypothetical protein NQ314_008522 [Rhamnusium bicolor]
MPDEKSLLQCYNRGCGQKYDPDDNKEDSCRHHSGLPVFHDAYKGWGCCNKKCTDFTEFLNIKGCTLSKHSNIKPPEPEKPVASEINYTEVIEIKPIVPKSLERPSFHTPLGESKQVEKENNSDEINIGTPCKNGGCTVSYEGPKTNSTVCTYHPGVPIFHEGLKYWSCCQKKTTDFNTFINQIGCESGCHVWKKENTDNTIVQCRWDFHQTASHVVVAIYAKQYCPTLSVVKLNPIRLYTSLVFPEQSNAMFVLDIELRGIIKVEESQVSMFGTKVEIKLKKAEPGTWVKLGDPVVQSTNPDKKPMTVESLTPQVDAVDLDDL